MPEKWCIDGHWYKTVLRSDTVYSKHRSTIFSRALSLSRPNPGVSTGGKRCVSKIALSNLVPCLFSKNLVCSLRTKPSTRAWALFPSSCVSTWKKVRSHLLRPARIVLVGTKCEHRSVMVMYIRIRMSLKRKYVFSLLTALTVTLSGKERTNQASISNCWWLWMKVLHLNFNGIMQPLSEY